MPGGYVTIMLHMVAEMEKLGAVVKTAASVVDLEVSGLRKITVAQIAKFANFWRARSRLRQNEIVQENMRLTAFVKLYKMCILLHRCNLNFLAKSRVENQQFS